MQRSERMQYMVEKERLLLLDLIQENRTVLLSRVTDARIIPVKARTWETVAKSLAASGLGPQRTVKQVKKIWENMRSRAKKFNSDQKKNLCQTGSGPPNSVVKPDPVLEKILALIPDELEPAQNHNDSDSWPTDVTVAVLNERGEQMDEPMAMTGQSSTACTVPISLMPAGDVSAPLASTSSGNTTLLYSPAIQNSPLPFTSVEVRGTVVSSYSSNHCTPLPSTSVEAPATIASMCSTPPPSTSGLASVPATFAKELPPMHSSSATGKVSRKKIKTKKSQMENSSSKESYEMLSKLQKEEHEIVMQIHKQNLENIRMEGEKIRMEGEYLRKKMQMMDSLYSQARDTMEGVRAVAGEFVDFMDKFRKDEE